MPKLAVIDLGIKVDFNLAKGTYDVKPHICQRGMSGDQLDSIYTDNPLYQQAPINVTSQIRIILEDLTRDFVARCPSLRKGYWWTEFSPDEEAAYDRYIWEALKGKTACGQDAIEIVISPEVMRLPALFTKLS